MSLLLCHLYLVIRGCSKSPSWSDSSLEDFMNQWLGSWELLLEAHFYYFENNLDPNLLLPGAVFQLWNKYQSKKKMLEVFFFFGIGIKPQNCFIPLYFYYIPVSFSIFSFLSSSFQNLFLISFVNSPSSWSVYSPVVVGPELTTIMNSFLNIFR